MNCGSYVSKVSLVLDANKGIRNWSVDTSTKDKFLRVETESLSGEEVVAAVEKAGLKASIV